MKPIRKTQTKAEGIWRLQWPSGKVTYKATAPWWIDAAGKRHNPSRSFDTFTDARSWRAGELGERARGVKRPTGRARLGEYLTDWLAAYERRNPGNTCRTYKQGIAKLEALPLWRMRLGDLEPTDVSGAYDALDPKAVPYVHDGLHRALADAVPKLIGRNPATGAARGRQLARAERSVWDEDEYRAWLAAIASDELAALWRFFGQTGARRGEGLGLDWQDLDLEANLVAIRRQYTVVGGIATLKDLKTPRSRRTIDVDAETMVLLREHRKAQRARKLGRDAHAVFTYADGARVGPTRSLNDRLAATIARAGVRPITLHDLRHTHASLLLRRGVPVHVVSRRLGHANEAITLITYAHLLPDQGRLAADVAGAIATQPEPTTSTDHA